ncbi:hypothetical protein UFOVP569_44 [uncultured Caudovirales phage]|uniref:Uncharacterized protein n=1 Tax=uncultured Caudovirales phage TaxID=2100421 RepID=A0A6J5QCQ1_9CAUD|nr:hypothetical protein UFOVP569_44 [uncultured Caudovirales phage]CAB4182580.1 hypothetical protein UFOVP1093_7 [uncultured Caudovirales phage]CAB4199663.1 hypothetical protein UFOVP1340_6 [uncultured Caudovirales phage]CAB4213431.1 hypothetical protein UFOVP1448_17 [uncultured Caudovirales phage]CAB4218885.1 hypothetical protein UFOVP1600_43 [uncultured Caudovirales phage]
MKRCKDCANEVYGDDKVCTMCKTNEWKDMHSPNSRRAAIESFNTECHRRERIKNAIHNGIIFAVLLMLGAAFIANIPDALKYESEKLNRVRKLTGE